MLPAVILLVMADVWMGPILTSIVGDEGLAWTILRANILAITIALVSFTAPVSILGLVTEDFDKKTIDNFLTAPIKRSQISISYIVSGVIFGFIITLIMLLIGQTLLIVSGDGLIEFTAVLKLLLLSLLALTSLSTIFFFIVSNVKSVQVAGSMTGLMGGFAPIMGGVYIQLSQFPMVVATILNLFPFSHTLALFKRILITQLIEDNSLSSAIKESLFEILTIDLEMFGNTVSPMLSIMILVVGLLIFGGLSVLKLSKMKNK
jgi:multidrug/hemolysin transport system permease protein